MAQRRPDSQAPSEVSLIVCLSAAYAFPAALHAASRYQVNIGYFEPFPTFICRREIIRQVCSNRLIPVVLRLITSPAHLLAARANVLRKKIHRCGMFQRLVSWIRLPKPKKLNKS
jgi:hypothetical protein